MKATGRPGKKRTLPKSPASRKASAPAQAEERLLVEAAQSDPARFDALYELNFERVYGFIAGRVRDRGTAEDLTSEVFYKALANLRSFEWRGVPFVAWLLRIAANAVIDRSQRAAREHPLADDPPDPGFKPDLRAIEHRARLFQLVQRLPETQLAEEAGGSLRPGAVEPAEELLGAVRGELGAEDHPDQEQSVCHAAWVPGISGRKLSAPRARAP